MKNYLTSSEIASRFHTTIDAIRYYEKIGLLHPKRNPKNNYRQFTSDDVRVMALLQELTRLHIPLSVICKLEEKRNVKNTLSLLELEKNYIKKEIQDLKKIEKRIQSRISFIEKYHTMPTEQFVIEHIKERKCLKISDFDIPLEDFDLHVSNLATQLKIQIPVMGVSDCYTLNINRFKETGRFDFDNIFYYADIPDYVPNYILPEGDYLVYTLQRKSLTPDYNEFQKILDYAKQEKLPIGKEAYFFFVIDEDESADLSEHVIQVQIPLF